MVMLYEHKFQGGTAIRFIDKPFDAAQKEVLAVEIDGIVANDRIGTFFAFLFDNDTKEDLAKELYIALHERYNPELKLFKDVICKTCHTVVCDNCKRLAHGASANKARMTRDIKVDEILKKKRGRPRTIKGKYVFTGRYSRKSKEPMAPGKDSSGKDLPAGVVLGDNETPLGKSLGDTLIRQLGTSKGAAPEGITGIIQH